MPEGAAVNVDATHVQAPDVLIARTPASQFDSPVEKLDNVAPREETKDAQLGGAPVDPDAQTTATLTPDLEGNIEGRVDSAVEQAVEEAVERALQSFCEYDLDAYIDDKLTGDRFADRDELEQLESRIDDLEESYNGVGSDDLDAIKCDMAALSHKIDLQRALTDSMITLTATCDALALKVAKLELLFASRSEVTTATPRARSQKRST
ncbi:hypothetical protein [Gemmatimonas sp.]|uniref:hypothetical protein n=1 Tax=Gemmatimonas sp. TaxID=1962908 RepID=UPI003F716B1B